MKTLWLLALIPALVLFAGCGDDDDDDGGGGNGGTPVVVVTLDQYGLAIGGTTTASAETVNGSDTSYSWSSSDDAVATVDGSGTVTAVGEGQAVITATGDDSGAQGSAGLVVFAEGGDDDGGVPDGGGGGGPIADLVAEWEGSGHADSEAEAFRHWDGDDPAEVPTSCAQCHSSQGFTDYVQDFSIDSAVPAAEVQGITCSACHNEAANQLSQAIYPSGVILTDLGGQARCQTCHQGRESTDSLDAALGDADPDTVLDGGRFRNIHYLSAGATLNGALTRGGYQYAGLAYDARFQHAAGLNACTDCHNPHSLEIRTDVCVTCHAGADSVEAIRDIRMADSATLDFDGDGDVAEGIYYETQGLRDLLIDAIQTYATDSVGTSICYGAGSYPYWFVDDDGNGTCEETETTGYSTWTPRLLQAAYNYQYGYAEPGAYAHNGTYVVQLLHDSVASLAEVVTLETDIASLPRTDPGHFDGASEAFRHWDEYAEDGTFVGEVEPACSKCHGGVEGFENYVVAFDGTTPVDETLLPGVPAEHVNGLECAVCHGQDQDFTQTRGMDSFAFPGGVVISDYQPGTVSVTCATCHSGRESQATIDEYLAGGGAPRFRNVHYKPAAGSLLGTEGNVGYEYEGMTYTARFTHTGGGSNACTFCHPAADTGHTFLPDDAIGNCTGCHDEITDSVEQIRLNRSGDYDGDGNTDEPLAEELAGLRAALMTQLQAAADPAICYNEARYPYWFVDADANGTCDEGDTTGYNGWTVDLVRAAHNFQFATKDPGSWAHNFNYHAQLLIDAIAALGGDTTPYVRPEP